MMRAPVRITAKPRAFDKGRIGDGLARPCGRPDGRCARTLDVTNLVTPSPSSTIMRERLPA